ncbi:MAG: phosphate signaling complex protein PhoU [Anaerolineaceae bacterium]|nr:phosphate signaling complex protein PhoU [Anaerolineaceae bacterium]
MPRESLDREFRHLQDEVLLLGSMVEQAILEAVDALKRRDIRASRRILGGDRLINEKRYAIENAILVLIATQQPMAHDLRFLAAILEVDTELERIGDYAKGIAKVNILLGEDIVPMPVLEISRMTEISISMLHRALSCFVNENAEQARTIPAEDDQVDELYNQVYRDLVAAMVADPSSIDHANYLLWVAHNLERTADRVTNICERTVFIATGELMEITDLDEEDMAESE